MPRERGQLEAFFTTLDAGVNSGVVSQLVQPNQVSWASNVTFRGGYAKSRPKFDSVSITWDDEDMEDWANTHPVQGKTYYKNASGLPYIVASIGGWIMGFKWTGNGFEAQDLNPPDGRNSQYIPNVWMQQAGRYLIIQDGQSLPIIIDGSVSRRSNPVGGEIPVGRQMAFVNNRLALVLTDRRSIAFGDFYGVTPTSVLEFTEIVGSAEDGGGVFSIPVEAGEITQLVVTAQTDTAAGQGILLVATDNAVCSFNPVFARSQWPQIQFQSVALIGQGFSGPLTVVNGDVWGRSLDGIRSFIMARREFASWGNTPQSREVSWVTDADTPSLLRYCDSVYFDNRLLVLANPQKNGHCETMLVLNFDAISSIRGKSTPAWEGQWQGINPYGFVRGMFDQERCFALCYSSDELFSIWEITKMDGDDDDQYRIQSYVETKAFDYGSPFIKKQMAASEFASDQLAGTTDFTFKYRPDQYPCWQEYATHTECWKDRVCDSDAGANGCIDIVNYSRGYNPKQDLPRADASCMEELDVPLDYFYQIQFRVEWVGRARIRWFLAFAQARDQISNVTDACA